MPEHREHACPARGCGHMVCMTPEHEKKLRQSHESFYCPAGHSMSFTGMTRTERELADTKAKVGHLEWRIDWLKQDLAERDRTIRSLRAKLAWRERWLKLKGLAKVA